jgi:hypothetical protein
MDRLRDFWRFHASIHYFRRRSLKILILINLSQFQTLLKLRKVRVIFECGWVLDLVVTLQIGKKPFIERFSFRIEWIVLKQITSQALLVLMLLIDSTILIRIKIWILVFFRELGLVLIDSISVWIMVIKSLLFVIHQHLQISSLKIVMWQRLVHFYNY